MNLTEKQVRTLHNLMAHVAYAEHWLRDTDAFHKACEAFNMKYIPGKGLIQTVEFTIANPYEGA